MLLAEELEVKLSQIGGSRHAPPNDALYGQCRFLHLQATGLSASDPGFLVTPFGELAPAARLMLIAAAAGVGKSYPAACIRQGWSGFAPCGRCVAALSGLACDPRPNSEPPALDPSKLKEQGQFQSHWNITEET